MKKAFKLLVFSVIALMLFSICVLADTVKVTPSTAEDIDSAISSANDGDTVEIDLVKDMDVSKTLSIDKAIALVVNFNGYQLNYTGTGSYFIGLTNALATVTLNGSNPMSNPSDYTHYSDSVKSDMKGNNSLICIEHGTLNINNAYLLGSNNGWIVNAPIKDNNDTLINISGSVLRMPQGSSYSAISSEGANQSSKLIVRRALVANSSVLYGGFKGRSYNFNFTAGTSFTNVKFYDFKIANDSWYDTNDSRIAALMMNSFESAVMLDGCVFKNYDESLGNVDVVTGTGKQNIKLLNCTFDKVTGSLGSDRGGNAMVFVITEEPTCTNGGKAIKYSGTSVSSSEMELSASTHRFGQTLMTYPNGYTNAGVGVIVCEDCGYTEQTSETYAPIFVNLGYSANENGDSVVLGTKINQELLSQLKANSQAELDFGVIAGNEQLSVSVNNGEMVVENGFSYSCASETTQVITIKLIGITEEKKDLKFVMEFYAFDGENVEYSEKELDATSFNDIIYAMDEVRINSEKLLESKHKLYYNEDGSFRVLIMADLHMNAGADAVEVQEVKDRVKLLVDRENPDLVIFTGDNTIGSSSESTLRNNITAMVSYIEEKQIPWCHVYGNHDHEGALSKEEQQKVYESFEYCISKDVEELSGVGNYVHAVYNRDGSIGSVIYLLDSGSYASGGGYDYIKEDQIAWYAKTSDLLKEYNGGVKIPGMMAFHIPLKENDYAYQNRDNRDIVYEVQGARNEGICCSATDTELFETILEKGDVKAIVTGHDHVNDYMFNYYGVKLCSSPNISDLTYHTADYQGSRVFDLNESTLFDIPTYVSYIIERVNPDKFDNFEDNVSIGGFGTDKAPTLETTGYDTSGLSGTVEAIIGEDGVIRVKRSNTGNFEINIMFDESQYGKLGNNKYLVVWVDFTNVDFRKACFGILSTDGVIPYRTDDYDSNSPFYYLAEGESQWQQMSHGNDGCFGTAQNGGVNGMKGYLALPTDYFCRSSDKATGDTLVTGIYIYADVNLGLGEEFCYGDFKLVTDYENN